MQQRLDRSLFLAQSCLTFFSINKNPTNNGLIAASSFPTVPAFLPRLSQHFHHLIQPRYNRYFSESTLPPFPGDSLNSTLFASRRENDEKSENSRVDSARSFLEFPPISGRIARRRRNIARFRSVRSGQLPGSYE